MTAASKGRTLAAVVLWLILGIAVAWRLRAGAGAGAPGVVKADALDPSATQILFVGNSFVFVNDLPHTLERLSLSLGRKVAVDSVAPGGYTFQQHAQNPGTRSKIAARAWDFVVLQEQSQRPSFDDAQVAEEVTPFALELDAMAHQGHPDSKTVFYETWGRKNGDSDNCREVPAICTYAGMQERLNHTYAALARQTGGVLAPVGQAWALTRTEHPAIELYSGDGIHPSRQGTYLAACVLFATMFRQTPVGASALELKQDDAAAIQAIAQRVVLSR